MSIFGKNSFDLIMNYYNENKEEKSIPITESAPSIQYSNDLKITSLQEAICTYKQLFSELIPKIDSEKEIHKYILETMKIEDEMQLYERYIFSIYIAMNKHLLNDDIKKDILEEEFHLTLMNWLVEEKRIVVNELDENNNIYNFNIFIGLSINIITIFEILPIKSSDLSQFNFYKKLFKLNKFVILNKNININISLSFLINKIENILKKWKIQTNCYSLAKKIKTFNEKKEKKFLGKKTLRHTELKEREDTEADSCSDRGESTPGCKSGGLFKNNMGVKKNKKVNFDLDKNQTFFYDEKEKVAHFQSIMVNVVPSLII